MNESIQHKCLKNKKPINTFIFLSYAIIIIAFIIALLISIKTNIPFGKFTRDPAAINNASPFLGIFSNIGILLWTTTATMCFFSFFLIREMKTTNNQIFILVSGILTTILLLDDFFMGHEYFLPYILKLPEYLAFVFYGMFMLVYILCFYENILKSNKILFFLSLIFFATSIASDQLLNNKELYYLVEDGLKFLGIYSWFLYYSKVSFNSISKKATYATQI